MGTTAKCSMSDSLAPFCLRMELTLKNALSDRAKSSGRTLTGEINRRLRNSLEPSTAPAKGIANNATFVHVDTKVPEPGPFNAMDQAILDVFRAMPPEKQLAMISLFK